MGKKTKVVLDTNIWISIFLNKTLGKEFDNLLRSRKIQVFVSEEILKEISRVLEYPKNKGDTSKVWNVHSKAEQIIL